MSAIPSDVGRPSTDAIIVPWFVYGGAILLIGWAAFVPAYWMSSADSGQDFGPLFWKAMIPVALELAVGAGLLLRRRWAWLLGIATAVVLVADGVLRFVLSPYRDLTVLLIWVAINYLIPAIVLLVCLLPARARRAYLRG